MVEMWATFITTVLSWMQLQRCESCELGLLECGNWSILNVFMSYTCSSHQLHDISQCQQVQICGKIVYIIKHTCQNMISPFCHHSLAWDGWSDLGYEKWWNVTEKVEELNGGRFPGCLPICHWYRLIQIRALRNDSCILLLCTTQFVWAVVPTCLHHNMTRPYHLVGIQTRFFVRHPWWLSKLQCWKLRLLYNSIEGSQVEWCMYKGLFLPDNIMGFEMTSTIQALSPETVFT